MKDWTEGDVDSTGFSVHFYRTGRGDKPPLVLAHGLTDNGLCWARTASVLEASFDVVMVDARNHGQSGHGPAGLKAGAGDMAAVISHLGLEAPAAMGHSVGASIVAGLAAYYPEKVSRIILEDPPWTLEPQKLTPEKTKKRLEGFQNHVRSFADLTIEEIIEHGRRQNPTWHDDEFHEWAISKQQVAESAMRNLELGEWSDTVPHICCPALLIYADGIITREMARTLEASNAQISSQQIADAGHNVRREQFETFVDVARKFLAA
jgi:pimeloyl-ACP methyl ester carboxylesterase